MYADTQTILCLKIPIDSFQATRLKITEITSGNSINYKGLFIRFGIKKKQVTLVKVLSGVNVKNPSGILKPSGWHTSLLG